MRSSRQHPLFRLLSSLALVLPLVAGFSQCRPPIRGEFGFSPVDRRDSDALEKTLLTETEFRLGRENLYFYDHETIWWIYRMEEGPYSQGDFLVSLYENNLTPEPVEVDMRHVDVMKQGSIGIIQQRYEPLRPGDYILKIAQHARVVDEARFRVLPGEPEVEDEDSVSDESDDLRKYARRADS